MNRPITYLIGSLLVLCYTWWATGARRKRRDVREAAGFAAWLYELVGRWIVEAAQPAWDADDPEGDAWYDSVQAEVEEAYRQGIETGMERGWKEAEAELGMWEGR